MFTNSLAIGLVLLAQGSPAMQMSMAAQVTTLPAPSGFARGCISFALKP